MKNLILITIAVFTLQVSAQRPEWTKNKGEHPNQMMLMQDFSAEQMATLQTKRMVLQLDLTEAQIAKVDALNLTSAKARKEKMNEMKSSRENKGKPSSDDRYKMMMGRLDHRITYKKEIKAILDKEQYEKWEKTLTKRIGNMGQNFGGKPNFIKRG